MENKEIEKVNSWPLTLTRQTTVGKDKLIINSITNFEFPEGQEKIKKI
jgi:hypothetical protein